MLPLACAYCGQLLDLYDRVAHPFCPQCGHPIKPA